MTKINTCSLPGRFGRVLVGCREQLAQYYASGNDRPAASGRLAGNGGTFDMTVDLPQLQGDLIDVTGTSNGSHTLVIANPDQRHDPPPKSALAVVKTGDGVATFGSKPVEGGTYLYFLARGNGANPTPNSDDWYLVAASRRSQLAQTSIPGELGKYTRWSPSESSPIQAVAA
jgi:outer membrane autotransporter protein